MAVVGGVIREGLLGISIVCDLSLVRICQTETISSNFPYHQHLPL